MEAELLERPLPKPGRDLVGYICARVLEALLEALLALEFLGRGYTRNAAGKAFQAWKALLGALLALERDNLDKMIRGEEERKWLLETGIPRIPTSRLKRLSQLLERVGYKSVYAYTAVALDLHDYQYHGPDPSGELSKYTSPEEAAEDIVLLLGTLIELVEDKIKPRLEQAKQWTQEHSRALQQVKQKLKV